MILLIGGVLDAAELSALCEAAADLPFEDGRATAGRFARDVKANLQAARSPGRDAIFEKVRRALLGHPVFQAAARPRVIGRMLLSRYGPGMAYGPHVDDPIIDGHRTDLSFSLPLSPPEAYGGGGLAIEDGLEERVIRPGAGDAVVYPTGALHRVEPVTAGERLAVVGWVTSWVRDPARREILFDLDCAAQDMGEAGSRTPGFDRLLKARANLTRMWADG